LFVQIFDAFIIGSSFAIDIVFLGGVSGEEGQKAEFKCSLDENKSPNGSTTKSHLLAAI
jgi:hypothetical protein